MALIDVGLGECQFSAARREIPNHGFFWTATWSFIAFVELWKCINSVDLKIKYSAFYYLGSVQILLTASHQHPPSRPPLPLSPPPARLQSKMYDYVYLNAPSKIKFSDFKQFSTHLTVKATQMQSERISWAIRKRRSKSKAIELSKRIIKTVENIFSCYLWSF